jgi:hypothetical protein
MDIREVALGTLGTRGKLAKPTVDRLVVTVDGIATDGTIHDEDEREKEGR